MKKICFLVVIFLTVVSVMKGQDESPKKLSVSLGEGVNVKFGGFVRGDLFLDTRKGREAVDGLIFINPYDELLDAKGKDLNEETNYDFSAALTRFNALFTGPEALGMNTSAFFEFDFSNTSNKTVLVRHAWIKLANEKQEFLLGRSWHPFQGPVNPSCIGAAFGAPFHLFARGEQFRYTRNIGSFKLMGAAYLQSAFPSFGPEGASYTYSRYADIPDLTALFYYQKSNSIFGLGVNYKQLKPTNSYVYEELTYATDEKVNSVSAVAYGQYNKGLFTAKAVAMYGENMADGYMQGGYAVKSKDPLSGEPEYTVSKSVTSWVNFTYGKKWVGGLFLGYQKSLGMKDNPMQGGLYYGYGQNIGSMYRISPSIVYNVGRLSFQLEEECTQTSYGNVDFADKGKVKDTHSVVNFRTLFVSVFNF